MRHKKYKYEKHPYYPQTGDADDDNLFSYMKLSAYDNSNSCKYENMLVAQNEITRYKKRHGIDIKSASEVEIDDKRTPDEVFNNMERSEEEKNHILQNYENYYINQLFDHIEDEVMIATAENGLKR